MLRKLKCISLFAACLWALCTASGADPNEDTFKMMKSFMDFETNPCDNFFKYSCGNFAKAFNKSLTDYEDPTGALTYLWNDMRVNTIKSLDESNEVYKKLQDYYKTCTGSEKRPLEGLKKYAEMFSEVEPEFSWMEKLYAPSFEFLGTNWNWTEYLGKLRRYGVNDFLIHQDFHRTGAKEFYIYLSMAFPNFEQNSRYKHFIQRWIQADATKAFGQQVEKLASDLEDCYRKHVSEDKPGFVTLKELSEQVPEIDFYAYLTAVFNETFDGSEKIYVKNLPCLHQLGKIVADTPKPVVAALMAIVAENYLLAEDSKRLQSDYPCIHTLWTNVPFAVNYAFHKAHFAEKREAIQSVVDRVFNVVREKCSHVLDNRKNELGETYYNGMHEKILEMRVNVGNLPNNVDEKFYVDYHKDWKVGRESVTANFLHLLNFKHTRYNFLLKNPDLAVDYWLGNNTVVTPKYTDHTNVLVVPYAYFHEPIFHLEYKDIFLFSTLGSALMNQFIHGFTPKGQRYDAHGVPTDTFRDFHNNGFFKAVLASFNSLPPTYDINDKMADYLGVHYNYEAYFDQKDLKEETYENDLNDKKVFFIKFTQFYCTKIDEQSEPITKFTPYNRLNQLLHRTSALQTAFNCPPADKAHILW